MSSSQARSAIPTALAGRPRPRDIALAPAIALMRLKARESSGGCGGPPPGGGTDFADRTASAEISSR